MANRNLVLQLLITARDNASSVIGSVFGFLDKTTSATANKIRESLGNLFTGQVFNASAAFEEAMSRIQAVMRPLPADFEKLKAKALELGQSTRFTATEAAEGLEILAKAGFTSSQAIAAIEPVLNLAQGASLSLADAAGYVSDSLTQFGLAADQSARVTDVLSKAANSANMTVGDMGQAFKYVGGYAAQAGLSIEQTAAFLDVFAQAGLRADMAGTALRDLLQDINNPASEARESMFKLGISTNNLFEAIEGLRKAGPNATQAIQDFGVRSSGAMFTLVRAGTDGVKSFEAAIKGAGNYASESRKIMDDTFKGAVFALQSAWEGLAIALQTPILDPLKNTVKNISNEMNRLSASGIFQAIGKDIATVFDAAGKSIVSFLKTFDWEALKTKTKTAVDSIETYFNDLVGAVKGSAQQLSDISTTAFSPITTAINGYRIALALATGDQEKVAKIQAEIEAQSAAISRTLNGTSAAYANLGTTAKTAGEQIKTAADSQQSLQTAQQNAAANVTALSQAVAAQEAKTAALSAANAKGAASTDEYGASVLELWTLQKQLSEAQTRLKTAQDALNQAQTAGGAAAQAQAAGVQATAQSAAVAAVAAKNYTIEWSKAGAEIPKVTEAQVKLGAGFATITRASGDAAQGGKSFAEALQTIIPAGTLLTAATTKTADSISALKQKVLDANAALAEQKTAYDEAKKAGTLAGDSYQKLQQAQAAAQNAMQNLTLVTGQHVAIEQKSALAATQTAAAIDAKNAASAKEAEKLAAVALASGDAYAAGKALEGIQVTALANAEKSAVAKGEEAASYEALAKAATEQYEAAKLNTALSPETLKGLEAEATKTKQLALEKREQANVSQEVAEKMQAEIFSIQGVTAAINSAAYAAGRMNASQQNLIDSQIESEQAAIRLAKATGDEAAEAEHATKLKELQIEKSDELVKSKQAEADAAHGVVDALIQQAEANGVVTAEEAAGIETAQTLAEAKQNLADAAEISAEAAAKEAEALAAAGNAAKEAAAQAKAAGSLISDAYNGAISVLSGLSDAAVAEFKRMRGETVATTDDIEALTQKTEALDRSIGRVGVGSGMVGFLTQIADDSNQVSKAFLGQAIAAENLTEQLNRIGEAGGVTGGALEYLIRQAENSGEQFRLLDQARLDNLQAALEKANDKIREMQQETQDAQDRLAELNAELLESRGEDEKAALLRQQLDYQQALAEIENQRQTAELTGNRDLLDILNQQKQVLEDINTARVANITADAATPPRSTTTASAGSGGMQQTFNITVDGKDLLSEDQIRNKIMPVLARATRLNA